MAKQSKAKKKTKSHSQYSTLKKVLPMDDSINEAEDDTAGEGHNSGQVNEALQDIFADYLKLEEDSKAINKAKRDLRAKAKSEHGVASSVFNHEIKLQKMESDTRIMFETGYADLKSMLGIQLSLSLNEDDENAPDPLEAAEKAANE